MKQVSTPPHDCIEQGLQLRLARIRSGHSGHAVEPLQTLLAVVHVRRDQTAGGVYELSLQHYLETAVVLPPLGCREPVAKHLLPADLGNPLSVTVHDFQVQSHRHFLTTVHVGKS